MNWQHLTAIIWVRWRLFCNQFARSSRVNKVVMPTLLILAMLASVGSFVMFVSVGRFLMERVSPIYLWDGVAACFLFGWAVSMMTELQRSETLSLRNLLHLPVSLSGGFFLNYLSSLASLSVLLVVPAMLGLGLASVAYFGAGSLVTLALVAAFLLMVTSVSYQLRGWLARLMENKRTRGTVVAITTMLFVLFFQIPMFLNVASNRSKNIVMQSARTEYDDQLKTLEERRESGELSQSEYGIAVEAEEKTFHQRRDSIRETKAKARREWTEKINAVLPIGWLPYGASVAAAGATFTPWLCFVGMTFIGVASLTLAFRSTLRDYTGERTKFTAVRAEKHQSNQISRPFVATPLPFLSDTQAAVALASFQSLLRAPESKMALLTPLIFSCVFGSMMFNGAMSDLPELARPWIGIGSIGMALFGMAQLMFNTFGLDRRGFQAYVLMPVRRSDVLLGKNLGTLPITLVLSVILVVFLGIASGSKAMHIVAMLVQIVISLMVFFPICNHVSMVAPVGMATGTMKPKSMTFRVFLTQFFAMLTVPLTLVPAALALALDGLADYIGFAPGFPVFLTVTLAELPVFGWCYLRVLRMQGDVLQEREQQILQAVTKTGD
ncbi:MAG: hypothetical protein AAGJ40_12720 [Planctomycetota bacterium]